MFHLHGTAFCPDLIGWRRDCLIPANPPREALGARRRQANDPDHYHTVANPPNGDPAGGKRLSNRGYRPNRKTQQCRQRKKWGRS
jgi:hypothetical protein